LIIVALLAALASCALGLASAQADPAEYSLKLATASTSTDQAGGHPDFETDFVLKTVEEKGSELPATTQSTVIELPPGLLTNPTAMPTCSAAQLVGTDPEDPSNASGCPQDSQVGITQITLKVSNQLANLTEPVYNLEPRYGEPARLGFIAAFYPILIDTELRSGGDYGATARIEGISSLGPLLAADTTIWGVPADPSHDSLRLTPYEAGHSIPPQTPTGTRSSSLLPVPYTLNPSACGVPRTLTVTATPYALPELHSTLTAQMGPGAGCGLLEFKPDLAITPTTAQAQTGTGLDVNLNLPVDGLEHPNLLGEDEQKRVEVTLPEGVSANPSQAAGGLGVCSPADFARETAQSLPNQGCPETSKIGTVTATSPLVKETAEGGLFLAKPYQNPFGTLLAIYMVLKIPQRGVIVKLAGKITSDPKTGQLTTTFGEPGHEIPQIPVSNFHLHFREGARAPLITPDRCGHYESTATFESWGGQSLTTHPSFEITSGVNGGPCPSGGLPPFHPGLDAGSLSNAAGRFSPFNIRLTREDGEQEITHFSIKLPPGLLGKLAGIPFCSDAQIAAATARTGPHGGQEELDNPSCPAASQVGRSLAGSGVGTALAYAPGKIYLAGPYHGAPISFVAITAGVVGPFDIGTVVVRLALQVNPETGEVFLDSTGSDPIPHIIKGIPIHLRDIRAYTDRPEFTFNPTSCEPTSTSSTVLGSGLDFVSPLDDNPIVVSSRFQAADCAALPFEPKLGLTLKGSTKRAGNPALHAHLAMNGFGEAGLAYSRVTLPKSLFLDNAHIGLPCTRVIFKEGAVEGEKCPAGSIIGSAKAVTPILSEPLEGPIYLRSNPERELPDIAAALQGQEIHVVAVAHTDSGKGGGLRSTFEVIPDAPITSVDIDLFGGNKGLIESSRKLCSYKPKATINFKGHNGKQQNYKLAIKASGCGKGHKKHKRHGERGRGA
jgi:hypothetical protein